MIANIVFVVVIALKLSISIDKKNIGIRNKDTQINDCDVTIESFDLAMFREDIRINIDALYARIVAIIIIIFSGRI